jgi:hypothetical protein
MRGKYQVVLLALLAFGLLMAPLTARAGTSDGTAMSLVLCNSDNTNVGTAITPSTGGCDGGNLTPIMNDSGSPGHITFGNVIVGNWDVNVGNAFGSDGSLFLPNLLDLSSFDATNSGGGTGTGALKLQLTITGLTGPLPNLSALNAIGGTNSSNGSVTVTTQAFINTSSGAPGFSGSSLTTLFQTTTTGHTQPYAGSVAGTTSGAVNNTYSLTLVITLSSALADNSSFDDELSQVPEPATLSVLGAGLLALGTGLRRKLLKG